MSNVPRRRAALPRRGDPRRAALLARLAGLYAASGSVRAVADSEAMPYSTVYTLLKEAGALREGRRHRTALPRRGDHRRGVLAAHLASLYEGGMSLRKIAERTGLANSTVLELLREQRVTLRPRYRNYRAGRRTRGVAPSDTELVVLEGLAAGLTPVEIGERSGMRTRTCLQIISRLIRRHHAGSRAGLMSLAYDSGWLLPDENHRQPPGLEPPAVELRILALYAAGASRSRVARELGIGPDAVSNRSRALYARLGARDITHAIALAHTYGLLPGPTDPPPPPRR